MVLINSAKSKPISGLKRLRNLTRNVPPFTSPLAFLLLAIGLTALVLRFLLAVFVEMDAGMASPLALLALIWSLAGYALSLCAFFAIICSAYLTVTGNWDLFITWFLDWRAQHKDSFSAVTTSFRLIRKRPSINDKTGFFISMSPALSFPNRKASPILFDDDRHVSMIAGSRAGKGRSAIIPNLAYWKGSAIIYDPSGENYAATARYRKEVLGQNIVLLDPFGITGDTTSLWNPMNEIDFDNDPMAMDKCYMLAESIHADVSSDPYWTDATRKLLAICTAYVGTASLKEQCHLGSVRDLLMTSDPAALWMAMTRNDAFGGVIRRYGESNEARHEEEMRSTLEITRTAMKWLDSELMGSFVKDSDFSMKDLKAGNTSLYIVLPAGMGNTYKAWLRIIFNAAFEAMQDLTIAKPKHSTLFVLDEFPLLGKMERIKQAAGEAAKFGVKLFICAQDISQLKEHYGQSWETFIANSGLLIMFANNDLETQQYLSSRLGKTYKAKTSYSRSSSAQGASSNTSTSQELEDAVRTDQVNRQSSRQSGDGFYFIAGEKPMRLPRANYDQWNMIPKASQKPLNANKAEPKATTVPLEANAAE